MSMDRNTVNRISAVSLPAHRVRRLPERLEQLGLELSPLLGGDALIDRGNGTSLAIERRPQQAFADNAGLLTCLNQLGVGLRGYEFRQFETAVTAPRANPSYQRMLEATNSAMRDIGANHRPPIDTSPYRRLGDPAPGFRLSLITDRQGQRLLGFLGHNPDGFRIFLSADGRHAHTWRA